MIKIWSRALTGAWIETLKASAQLVRYLRRALTGAWIETTTLSQSSCQPSTCRALTGAWIETAGQIEEVIKKERVAPSRARGLKQLWHAAAN